MDHLKSFLLNLFKLRPSGRGSLDGHVFRPDGQTLSAGGTVTASNGETVRTIGYGADGHYHLPDVPAPLTYSVTAHDTQTSLNGVRSDVALADKEDKVGIDITLEVGGFSG